MPPRQDSDVSIPEQFFASEHGSDAHSTPLSPQAENPSAFRNPDPARGGNTFGSTTLARLLAGGSPEGGNPGTRADHASFSNSEGSVRRQDSEVSIPSRFFASEPGSSHPTEVTLQGHDAMENLSWFDRTRLELSRQSIDQGAQSLDIGKKSFEISKQSLTLSKISLGASVALGAAGLIISGLGTGKDSNSQPADGATQG